MLGHDLVQLSNTRVLFQAAAQGCVCVCVCVCVRECARARAFSFMCVYVFVYKFFFRPHSILRLKVLQLNTSEAPGVWGGASSLYGPREMFLYRPSVVAN